MTESTRDRESYLFERSDRESQRPVAQGQVYDRSLGRLFEDAGLAAGMRVLDIGSGAATSPSPPLAPSNRTGR